MSSIRTILGRGGRRFGVAVERWQNEVRELTKTRRGLVTNESAQVYVDLARINHNYCKPHSGLPSRVTPTVAAGIDLKLGQK